MAEIDGVPENDGGNGEVEAGGAIALVLEGPIADFAEAMEEHGPLESVVRLAFIEASIGAPPQGWIADPVEREERAVQTTDFLERLGEHVLTGIGGEAAQDRRRRYGAGLDRSRQTEDFVPILGDDAEIDNAANQRIERFVARACADDIKPAVGEIADTWRKQESQELAKTEHVIDRAGGVGVVLADVDRAFVVHEPVENMRRLAGVRRDDLGMERRVAIGDVGVELYPRLGAIFGVIVGARLAMSAGAEKLTVRG